MITPANNTFNGPDYEAITKAVAFKDFSKISELLKDFFTSFTIEQEKRVLDIFNERYDGISSFVHHATIHQFHSFEFIQFLMSCGANFNLLKTDMCRGNKIPNTSALDFMGETPEFGWNLKSMINKSVLIYLKTTMDKITSVNVQYRDTLNVSKLILEYYPNISWVNNTDE